jgi:hypothetical protein
MECNHLRGGGQYIPPGRTPGARYAAGPGPDLSIDQIG